MFEEIWYLSIIFTSISLILACYHDYKDRKIPVWIWKPAAFVGLPLSLITFILKIIYGNIALEMVFPLVISAIIVVVISTLMGYFEIFGGADSIAMSLVALTTFYYQLPVNTSPPFMLVFVNNWVVCMVAVAVIIVLKNIYSRNFTKLPLSKMWYLLIATRIKPEDMGAFHGSVLEVIEIENDGTPTKVFRPPPFGLRDTDYDTKKVVQSASYKAYKLLGPVWAMYYIPMILPITAAFFISLFLGDFNMMHDRLLGLPSLIINQYNAHGIFGLKPF